MREILFRGKYRNTGEWVFGDYMNYSSGAQIWTHDSNGGTWNVIVDPETVEQYTGLKDSNGVKIFEGDILKHDSGSIHEVVFEQRNGKAYFGWVISEIETWHFDFDFLHQLQVVGNIHDNPELLKAATGEDSGNAAQETLLPAT